MTDEAIAGYAVAVGQMEVAARTHWDAIAASDDAAEYTAVMGVVRQAGALRKSLEQLIVTRATKAPRAAASR
jgi:hypothetical protein